MRRKVSYNVKNMTYFSLLYQQVMMLRVIDVSLYNVVSCHEVRQDPYEEQMHDARYQMPEKAVTGIGNRGSGIQKGI